MIYMNENRLVKCAEVKAEAGFIQLDNSLIKYVNSFFSNRKYGSCEVSEDIIANLNTMNERIKEIKEEAERKISEIKSEDLELSILMFQDELKNNKNAEYKDKVEKKDNEYILSQQNEKTGKISRYILVDYSPMQKMFTVVSESSEKRNRTFKKSIDSFLNGRKTFEAVLSEDRALNVA